MAINYSFPPLCFIQIFSLLKIIYNLFTIAVYNIIHFGCERTFMPTRRQFHELFWREIQNKNSLIIIYQYE